MRQVIVHYHIFKNAGSTLDSMLERSFGERWVSFDKEQPTGSINPAELGEFIQSNPRVAAVSSHHAHLPLPEIDGVEILPALFLRHPLDRVRSVYDFEQRQGRELGPVSKGAEKAAALSFRDYLRWRLDSSVNGVVHNFQTQWLVRHPRFHRHPLTDEDCELAWSRLTALPFFGVVEHFDASIELFRDAFAERGVALEHEYVVRNQSARRISSLQDRLDQMRTSLGEAMWLELVARNQRDLSLYELADRAFALRLSGQEARAA